MEEPSKTSSSLIRNAQAENPDAWRDLVQLYSRRIYRWCRRAGLQPADAGNVVQEVLRSVARKLSDFRYESASSHSFRGWLKRITTNKITDHFRRAGKQPVQPRGGTDAHRQLLDVPSLEAQEPTWATSQSRVKPQLDPDRLAQVRAKVSSRDWKMFLASCGGRPIRCGGG